MLQVDVRKSFETFEFNITFEAGPGITVLFGRSGSGKTTLIRMLAGLIRPDSGRIAIGETVLFDHNAAIDVAVERRRLGYVFQDARLFPHMTVWNNLNYGRNLIAEAQRWIAFDDVVELLDLSHLLERQIHRLSGGETQRIAIARAILACPQVLLLDEPLASLDGPRKAEILPFLERLRDELAIPIIYVSHAVDEVARLADTVVLLNNGTVAAQGTVEEIFGRIDLYPLTGRYEAGAVLSTTVVGHDAEYALSYLEFPGGVMTVPHVELAEGTPVRLRVRARDVSLARELPGTSSILNILEAEVIDLRPVSDSQMEVALRVGPSPLVARVTRKAADALALAPGVQVFAQIKAIAVDRRNLGRAVPSHSGEREL